MMQNRIPTKPEIKSSDPDLLPRLSGKEYLILGMLVGAVRELYGLEMVSDSNGSLKRGTIYVTLQRMQQKGLIESKVEPRPAPEIGIPRRLYSVTGYGARVFRAYGAARFLLTSELIATHG